ncbi:hypothetical protein TRICI_000298 [Trichomonascus ciferrii]|uniref:Ribosomal protein L9 domain-containing protein n=1 Tax=Trichomonascus ciferrii TaxID=44093 RepID=A0A642VDT6_9ASCO|nr:hypothetical protein TRICI_000298 [Trichomonascus ciferrii]
MLAKRSVGMRTMLSSRRYASTKVSVQLLRDFPGLGYKGEVVQVAPGRMRNELHVSNGAAYVIKGEPLRLPLRTRESIEAEKAKEAALAAEQKERQRAQERIARQEKERLSRAEKVKKLTNLHFGGGSTTAAKEEESAEKSNVSAFIIESALRSLPRTIQLQRQTRGEDDGFLAEDLTVQDLAQHVTRLTGTQISPSIVKFSIKTGRKEYADSTLLDYIGSYRAVFTVPGGHPVFFDLVVAPSNRISDHVSTTRPGGPVPETQAQTPEPEPEEKSGQKPTKQFEWENELITNMEEKMKR